MVAQYVDAHIVLEIDTILDQPQRTVKLVTDHEPIGMVGFACVWGCALK